MRFLLFIIVIIACLFLGSIFNWTVLEVDLMIMRVFVSFLLFNTELKT